MGEAALTSYVILRRIEMDGGSDPGDATVEAWEEVGHCNAHGSEAAARKFLDDPRLAEGEWDVRAIPIRSWPKEPAASATIGTTRTVTFKSKKKEAASVA